MKLSKFFSAIFLFVLIYSPVIQASNYSFLLNNNVSDSPNSSIFIQIFKQEGLLELYQKTPSGKYKLSKTYPICKFSGGLGPKKIEGDLKSPEGFYQITAEQLNPNSRYYRSINIGFPNEFDKAQGYSGSYLMIHGSCVSVGCYAMTDKYMGEIYQTVETALLSGQSVINVSIYPFKMTNENNNSAFTPIQTTTNSISYFGDDNVMLKESFYSDEKGGKLALSFCIAETDPATGRTKFPKNKRQNVMINEEKAAAFEDIINTFFIPKYISGNKCSYGIFLNARKDALLEICLDENKNISLRYSSGINENKIPANIVYFQFKKTMIIKNYNVENGDCEVDEVDGQFLVFRKSLSSFNISNSSAIAHFNKHSQRWSYEQMTKQLGEMAIKMGLSPVVSGFGNKQQSTTQSGFNMSSNYDVTNNPAPTMESVDNLEDILNQTI